MAKIHVRGGSPLTLVFTDDGDTPNPTVLQLEAKRQGSPEYYVIETMPDGSRKKLKAAGPFTATNPNPQTCTIKYSDRVPAASSSN